MNMPSRPVLAGVIAIALVAGCKKHEPKPQAESDPAVAGALGDQIMVDPDLAGQNQGNAGVAAGSPKIELPPEKRSPEAIAAAKAEATKLAGGTLQPLPAPVGGNIAPLVESAATAAQFAGAAKTARTDCSQKVEYSAKWATGLPAELPVYPKGAVQEAAGTDADGCRLRVVSFVTPVAAADVLSFYYTRARAGGYDAKHQVDGNDQVLGGKKDNAAYVVYARKLDNGLTEVDLVAGGG